MIERKVKSLCVGPNEEYLFVGNLSGQVLSVHADSFQIASEVAAHPGGAIAVAAHPRLPYVAVLGMDRSVSVWEVVDGHRLHFLTRLVTRDIRADDDPPSYVPIQSVSQALGFHDTERRLLTRSGNAGVLELSFETGDLEVVRCTRLHGQQDVVTTRYVKDGDQVLSGSNAGEVALSYQGEQLAGWKFGHETVHWFEHLDGDTYLLASDTRAMIRLDISGQASPVVGRRFARDDLEHVNYNPVSGRAFASSFDRNVYEVDIDTCDPVRVVFSAPFKIRWIKTLRRDPDCMFVQSRNGALYKVSLDSGQAVGTIKDTPPALWSAVQRSDDEIILAGEGAEYLRVRPQGPSRHAWGIDVETTRHPLPGRPNAYTKRLAVQRKSGTVLAGRTDGTIVRIEDDGATVAADLGSPVRDLEVMEGRNEFFVATEDGRVRRGDFETGQILAEARSPRGEPVWAISYNETRGLLAFAEREGWAVIVDEDMNVVMEDRDTRRCKRMRWLDGDTLLVGRSAELHRIDAETWVRRQHVVHLGNSLEDFAWDPNKRYLAMVNYQRNVILADLASGHVLNVTSDQMDYSKGIMWLEGAFDCGYGYDFITLGRDGRAHRYRIHDEKVLSLGPFTPPPPQ